MIKVLWDGLILGVTMILMGIAIAWKGDFYSSKYMTTIRYGGYHVPIGIFAGLVGLGFLVTSFRKNKNIPIKTFDYVCPYCEMMFSTESPIQPNCQKCGIKTEPKAGFYERHPKLVNDSKSRPEDGAPLQETAKECVRCGEAFSDENLDGLCQNCRDR